MALLNIDPHITVQKLKRAFKKETGLDLIVYSKNESAAEDIELRKILGKEDFLKRRYSSNRLNNFYLFEFNIDVKEFKKEVSDYFCLKVDISHEGSILDKKSSLDDYIPSRIKNRKFDIAKVDAINERLIKIEKDIYTQWLEIKKRLNPRLADPADWLSDYEIELKIDYFIDDSDHLCEENTDSMLLTQEVSLGKSESIFDYLEEFSYKSHKKGFTSPHCYLFHDLYDHQRIPFKEIQRIGTIWVDLNVWHQHCYDKPADLNEKLGLNNRGI